MCTTDAMLDVLREHWGYDGFRPMQAEIISSVLSGHDTLGLMATGGGKSITFQVPALLTDGLTLVVTPLISLMKDQVDNLLSHGIRAYFLHSALTRSETRLIVDRCRLGKTHLLYVSPEKLQSAAFISDLKQMPVKIIVVDEAHCISQWGYDFRPSYLEIVSLRKLFPDAPVLALTASATPHVAEDITRCLGFRPGAQTFRLTFNRPNINYIVRHTTLKAEELTHILRRVGGCGIVYVRSRKRTREVSDILRINGISADYYHAGLSAEEKNLKQNLWKDGTTRIMVATTAFGMGIDKPDVRVVVHYDPPTSLEEYYQEAGRAGRDGNPSWAVSLVAPADKATLSRRISSEFPPKETVRDIYHRLGVFLDVAMGEGFERVFEFNLTKFCEINGLHPLIADHALKILDRSGYIEYVEETSTASRLLVLLTRRELYNLQLDQVCEDVFNCIMRNYTGIFADYEYISESRIASLLSLTEQTVYENLLKLSRMHVIHYVPRSTTPYIVYRRSREEAKWVVLPREVYEYRRKNLEDRVRAMQRFLFDDTCCRVETLLDYFGEKSDGPCGTCDVCRANHVAARPASAKTPADRGLQVAYLLRNKPMTLSQLSQALGMDSRATAELLRPLLDEETVRLDPVSGLFTAE